MPAGTAHKIAETSAAKASALSPEQFDQLMTLLDGQHRVIVDLLQPIHDIAQLMLVEHGKDEFAAEPPPENAAGRPSSEQSSG